MVWVERDLKDHLVPTPRHEQGHLLLDLVGLTKGKTVLCASAHHLETLLSYN